MSSSVGRRPTPNSDDLGLLSQLRRVLETVDFTVERVESLLGSHGLTANQVDRVVRRRRVTGRDAFSALTRLFLLGDDIGVSEIEPVLEPLDIDGLAALGLCVVDGSTVSPAVLLVPHGEYYIACDPNPQTGSETPFDYVPGVQAPSVTLAKLAVRTAAGSALDLGTGSGLQAMLAARHCRSVVATDVNERALAFARFNARLNGLDNIEFREGSAFLPVAGQRFDLVVANPPYVISPEYTYAYRDSEIPGDELCRQLVQEVPEYLNDGGFAHILVSWGHQVAEDWDRPLRDWMADGGCDAWLLHYRTRSPLQHATDWLRPVGEDDPAAFATALDRWLAYLAERGIVSVSYGAIVLRRRARPGNWIRTQQLSPERLAPASDHIVRAFDGNELLHELGDDRDLLAARLRLTSRHQIRQTLVVTAEGLQVEQAMLELTDGLRLAVGIDRYTMMLLPLLDGDQPLARALDAAAGSLDLTPEARRRFIPAALPVIRKLLELGFFELASAGG